MRVDRFTMKITKYVTSWFARADEDLEVVRLLLGRKGSSSNPACFHAQQAAEKCLKGFLAYHEMHIRKIHDLSLLLEECKKIESSFEQIEKDAHFLTEFYIESRYPDDYMEFSREDSEKAFEAATRLKDFILEKLKIEKQ